MKVEILRVNTVKDIVTNTYIVYDNEEIMVIDPGGEPQKIIEKIDELNAKLKYIVITHCHADHIGGIVELQKNKGGKVLASKKDGESINNPLKNLVPFVGGNSSKITIDRFLEDNDIINVGQEEFNIIATPGHTKGGICIYSQKENILFSGDTLFAGTCGRTDLPTGGYLDIMMSIKNKLLILPMNTIVYPGHGRATTIEEEQKNYE